MVNYLRKFLYDLFGCYDVKGMTPMLSPKQNDLGPGLADSPMNYSPYQNYPLGNWDGFGGKGQYSTKQGISNDGEKPAAAEAYRSRDQSYNGCRIYDNE